MNTVTSPIITIEVLIILVNTLLLVIGFARIYIGLTVKEYLKDYRGFTILIGVVVIILTLLIFLSPAFDNTTSIIIISLSILLSGLDRFILGLNEIKK